jgi:MoaA/NifB/PqqE/SkfB family radical SAM enzyme
MTLDDFRLIAAKLPPSLEMLKLTYAGEPLLNPDIFKMTRHFRTLNSKALIRISTNGTRINNFDPDEIFSSGVNQIDVAIEGATAQTHEAYRRGSSFDDVCGAVKTLCRQKRERGLREPRIVQMTLLSKRSCA